MSEVLNPNVIDPPGFDVNAGWQQCKDDADDFRKAGRDIAAAFCADPGICSCPACGQMHWAWGNRQRCLKCEFEYPTDAWAMYSWGVQAAWRTGGDATKITFPSDRKNLSHPYFRYGFENPINRAAYDAQKTTETKRGKSYDVRRIDLHDVFKLIDWRSIMSAAAPTPDHAELVKRLAAAAEEARHALDGALSTIKFHGGYGQEYHHWCKAHDALTAALNALPAELRGKQ